MEAVTELVAGKPVVIFGKSNCFVSPTVEALISSFGANPVVYHLDTMPNGQRIESALAQLDRQPAKGPAVFIGQEYIGGANAITTLHVKNELVPRLLRANAIFIWR
ncbi:monothiol glutaredoxin-S6-like [Fagus crenata]